jgi:orotate phosphoribosyltransferase
MKPPTPSAAGSSRARAFEIIKQRSFRFGTFTLASGETSTYYLDMKPTMFHGEAIGLLAELVLERIGPLKADYIGGLEMGAVPLITPVLMLSQDRGEPMAGFFVRKAAKDHGTKKLVEAPKGDLDGKKVVILEDVTTTGASPMQAVKAVQGEGANVALVLTVVDREAGAAVLFERAGIRFESIFKASEFLTG